LVRRLIVPVANGAWLGRFGPDPGWFRYYLLLRKVDAVRQVLVRVVVLQ